MNSASKYMSEWIAKADAKRAEQAYELLVLFSHCARYLETINLETELVTNESVYKSILEKVPSVCKGIERLTRRIMRARDHGHDPEDIGLVQNASAMFNILLQGAAEAKAPNSAMGFLDTALEAATNHYLGLATNQIDALCRYLAEIRSFLGELNLHKSRLIFVECPIGNSVPLKLLTPMFDDAPLSVVRVSLSRNDSKKVGIARQELLQDRLLESQLAANDIVVYLDEWNTGSNFNTLRDI